MKQHLTYYIYIILKYNIIETQHNDTLYNLNKTFKYNILQTNHCFLWHYKNSYSQIPSVCVCEFGTVLQWHLVDKMSTCPLDCSKHATIVHTGSCKKYHSILFQASYFPLSTHNISQALYEPCPYRTESRLQLQRYQTCF